MVRSRAGGRVGRVRLRFAVAVGVLIGGGAVAGPAAADHGGSAVTVVVDASRFEPFEVAVSPRGTVTWEVRQSGHTIVADDGRFAFFGSDGGTIPAGESREFTVGTADEVIRYHCSIHGAGMAGAIVVGHPRPVLDDPAVIEVPGDGAEPMTLEEAVAAAEPGSRIEIAPGRYTVSQQLEVGLRDADDLPHGVTVVGMGDEPSDVIIDVALTPRQGAAAGVLRVTGAFVTLANLTVDASAVSHSGAGIHVDGANQVALVHVAVDGAGWARDGVRITGARGVGLHGIAVRGARRAAVSIEPCPACGVLIDDAELTSGLVGVLASGARGVVVRDSLILGNAVGVVARQQEGRLSSIRVSGNHIVRNAVRDRLPAVTAEDRRLATGAGVWLDGTADSEVTDNTITGNTFGVVVSGGAREVTVAANRVGGNGTDLAWDGLGVDTCFAGHDPSASTSPPLLASLYPCGRPTVGVAYPPVNGALLAAAYA